MSYVYEPREDSILLGKYVKKYAKGAVLEIGTGTGYLSEIALKHANEVLATDINPDAVKSAKKLLKNKADVKKSDMFSNITKKECDIIIFNPPYLPQEGKLRDIATEGGKKGYETIIKFLSQAAPYLKSDGSILLLYSTLSNKTYIDQELARLGYKYETLGEKPLFMERLFVYKITKSKLLAELNSRDITDIVEFDKGKRGIILTGNLLGTKVAIKVENPKSKAIGRISNEVRWLRRLNRIGVGPELLHSTDNFMIYKFVEGEFIHDFLKKSTKSKMLKVLIQTLSQCRDMDKLNVTKEEMNHPHHHLIVDKNPVLIDFERCHYTQKPKNVTQFCQFILSSDVTDLLKIKKIEIDSKKLINHAKKYKFDQSEKNFKAIIKVIK